MIIFDFLQTERSFICADTGALMQEPAKRFQPYKGLAYLGSTVHHIQYFCGRSLLHTLS